MPGTQFGVPPAVAVRGDGGDAAVDDFAEVEASGGHDAGGRVLGLDVLGDEPGRRGEGADDLDLDRALGDGPELLGEHGARSLELEAPHRGQQVVQGVLGKEVVG